MIVTIQKEFFQFSKQNWWVYIVFLLCLWIIYFTNTGNIQEIFIVFIIYVLADICMMTTITLIQQKNYTISSIFQISSVTIFSGLFLYHYLASGQIQYLLGNIGFILGAIKNISKYNFSHSLTMINGAFVFWVNVCIFGVFYTSFPHLLTLQVFLQLIGFTFFSTCLVMSEKYIQRRYFLGLIGLASMVIGAMVGIHTEYLLGNIYGITICYFLLPLTVLTVYMKTIKKYINW